MRRYDSPKLRINQTYYPEQSRSRERTGANTAFREDSVDHDKYKPILRQSNSRLITPPVASRNNLFEAALSKEKSNLQLLNGGESMKNVLTQNIKTLSTNPDFENITRPEQPRVVRELVEKNTILDRRLIDNQRRIVLNTPTQQKKYQLSDLPNSQPARLNSPLLSPSSSNLYKPFFPGARTPKTSQEGDQLRGSSNLIREYRDSPGNATYNGIDGRSNDAVSKNFDILSQAEVDPNDLEAVRAENRYLRERLIQMEQDQELILQLNQLLLQKLSNMQQSQSEFYPSSPAAY